MAYVLVLGAGGNVSRHTVPKLLRGDHAVSALVHNPEHAARLAEAGATVIVQDLTELDQEGWARLLTPFDVVVWSAGAGGGSAEKTYAVDRDAALAMIDALEELGEYAPFLVNVSYAGAKDASVEDDGSSWYAYVEAKKAVDRRLLGSELRHQILGPTMLTDDPAEGLRQLEGGASEGSETPRELVADVIVEAVERGEPFAANPFEFEAGPQAVSEIS
ncbi:NAD(P)H-binding protein [Corynebacterium bouchesdurhonense]|uniref:NAD(P)H-binding protein n=1 Tax=Corynebacterium bouchesdurhonense TaxID=1720192 RepID=UPI0008300630|nr:NAD(P)H-binding protein [Corynebacterium bouchesdurhonense]